MKKAAESTDTLNLRCYVHVLGNEPGKRIGIVKWYETGYYPTTLDYERGRGEKDSAEVDKHVHVLNEALGISDDVAESAFAGSMFGWHVPAAQEAIDFYREKVRKTA